MSTERIKRHLDSASYRGSENLIVSKKYRDDSEFPQICLRTGSYQNKKICTENSERSHYSLFEEISVGVDVDPKNYIDRSRRRTKSNTRGNNL